MRATEPTQLGEFTILEKIGQGAMGAVYKARQGSLGRIVALKILPAHYAGDAEFVARFRHEASAAASLNHPNIVQIYAAGEDEGAHYFAMEYVEGESLGDRLDRKGRVEPQEAIAVAHYVALALDYAWKKAGVIHRDIKPDNIFLSREGTVKVGDLGLAKVLGGDGAGLTQTGTTLGTPYYVSPEQAIGTKEIDFRADIYSIGCTIFHAICGQPPYKGDSAMSVMLQHISQPEPKILEAWPECPPPIVGLLNRMLRKKPEDRYASYEELMQQMTWVSERLEQPTPVDQAAMSMFVPTPGAKASASAPSARPAATLARPGALVPPSTSGGSGKWIALAAVAVLLAGGAFVWQPWKKPTPEKLADAATPRPVVATPVAVTPAPILATPAPVVRAAPTPAPATPEPRAMAVATATPSPAPSTPAPAIAKMAAIEKPTATPSPAPPSPEERWKNAIDLLALVDVAADTSGGILTQTPTGLLTNKNTLCKLDLPYYPPAEYDFRMSFTYVDGLGEFAQMLTKSNHTFEWMIGGNGLFFGFQLIGGVDASRNATTRQFRLVPGRKYTSVVEVREDGLKSYLDDKLVSSWKTNYSDMSRKDHWALRSGTRLGIGTKATAAVIHGAEVLEVTGKGSLFRTARPASGPTASATPAGKTDAEGFVSLFNGRDLAGWDGDPTYWSVRNGVILGESPANGARVPTNTCLIWKDGKPADFELRMSYKITAGNSGVQYRSRVADPSQWRVGGYQYEIDQVKRETNGALYEELGTRARSSGGLYLVNQGESVRAAAAGERIVEKKLGGSYTYHTGTWNELVIVARGSHLTQMLNGKVTVELTDENLNARADAGVIALQLHAGTPQKVEFKDIRLKEFPAGASR